MTTGVDLPNRQWLLIDAAGLENGRADIDESEFASFECLFTGDLAVELEDCAPYLGLIDPVNGESQKVVERYAAKDCAVVFHCDAPELTFTQAHRHFRKFNVVYSPNSQPLFFRYYDGRVLPQVLEVLSSSQLKDFFGPFHAVVIPHSGGVSEALEVADGRLSRRLMHSNGTQGYSEN